MNNGNSNNYEDLNGMWFFTFYNDNEHKLLLSRDLLGENIFFIQFKKTN